MVATARALTSELFDATGRRVVLRGPGRSGGEGTVYEIDGRPLSLAKVFHPQRVTPELRDKIEAMRASPPDDVSWTAQRHRSIAWVEQLLFADAQRSRFAGFTMPRIDTARFREAHLYFDPQDRVRLFAGSFTWKHLLAAATNVASAVAAVHGQGHRIGDLRETNVLVAPTALIALIDCDSFQIRDPASGRVFHSRVATAEYLPPELHGADFRDDHDRTEADLFALGVLIFKMLMSGVHPYQARGPRVDSLPSTEAKIKRGLFPYVHRFGVEPPTYAPPYNALPPAVRALFKRCFVDGHRRPRKRPSAQEWFATLKAEGKKIRECKNNRNHMFGAHLRACPWCAMAQDPFPMPGALGRQTAVAAPPARAARTVTQPSSPTPTRRRLPRIRLTRRRVALTLGVVTSLGLLLSPAGHSASPVRRTVVEWSARATGPCPFDPSQRSAPDPGCSAAWRFGSPVKLEQHARRWFVFGRSSIRVEVPFEVRFSSARSCENPWIASLEFNARAAPVCFGTCPDRIEIRGARAPSRLIASSGVASGSGVLPCNTAHRGTWTFDIKDARGPLRLHHPGFGEQTLPRALA